MPRRGTRLELKKRISAASPTFFLIPEYLAVAIVIIDISNRA
jgi:hypothetical protein